MSEAKENLPLALVGGGATLDGDPVTPARGTLLAEQPTVVYEISAAGDLLLTQDDVNITIRRDCVLPFIDRLTDAIGIPGMR